MACNPSKYDDLGKDARDILNKNFYFGNVKLEAKSRANNGVDFTTSGTHNTDTGKVSGSLETKFKYADYGVTFSEKWNTDNILATEITIEDQLAKGLKLTFDTTFAPNTGKKSAKVKSAYKHDYIHTTADVDFDFAGPTVHGSSVVGYNGWMAGYQASYDTANSKLIANNIAVAYKTGDFVIHSAVNDGAQFTGTVHQQINDKLSAAAMLNWSSGSSNSSFTVGSNYKFDKDTSGKIKINNSLQVGLSFIHTLRPGIKMTLAGLIDAKNLDQAGHKLGLGLDLEA